MTNKFHLERPNREQDYIFRIFVCPRNFLVGRAKKRLPFTSQQKFQGICGKQPMT